LTPLNQNAKVAELTCSPGLRPADVVCIAPTSERGEAVSDQTVADMQSALKRLPAAPALT
jgi:hypothetical protein